MKKKLFIMILAISVLAISCASTDSDTKGDSVATTTLSFKDIDFKSIEAINKYDPNAPGWYNNRGEFYQSYGTDIIIGIGQATGRSASLTDKAATAAAQENAALQIVAIINGLGLDETSSITKVQLSGARVIKKAASDDNQTYYAAVMLDKKRVLQSVNRTLSSAINESENYTNDELDIIVTEFERRVELVQERVIQQAAN